MAHAEQQQFCREVKTRFPEMFNGRRVLDVGSLDINGNNRALFQSCEYLGIDIAAGPNVDLVCLGHEFTAPDNSFDVVISTECFEHDRYFPMTIRNCVRLLRRPGGLFVFTCATTGRIEHGTRSRDPHASPCTSQREGWADYYGNVTEADIRASINIESLFESYEFNLDRNHCDLRFWGIRSTCQVESQVE